MSLKKKTVSIEIDGEKFEVAQITLNQAKQLVKFFEAHTKSGKEDISYIDIIEGAESVIDEMIFTDGKSLKEQGMSVTNLQMEHILELVDPLVEVNKSFLLTLASKYQINLIPALLKAQEPKLVLEK